MLSSAHILYYTMLDPINLYFVYLEMENKKYKNTEKLFPISETDKTRGVHNGLRVVKFISAIRN